MAIKMGKLYAALRAANVPDKEAIDAAEEVAGFGFQLGELRSDIKLLKWMVATVVALLLPALWLLLRVAGKVGAL